MIERYAYLWFRYRRVRRFLAETEFGPRIQQRVLFEKLRRNAASRFGKEHRFDRIRTVDDFRRQVPISTYDYYRPYIEQVKQGRLEAMFGPGTRLLMFAMTSGTTSEPKYIPITDSFFREYRLGWNLWGLRLYWDHKDLVRKKTIKLASDWQQFHTAGGIPCGNISGLVAETVPLVARTRFLLPKALIKIHDPAAKHYTALRLALASAQVGMIGTANPSTLVEFARFADRHREDLLRDICNGTLHADFDVPAEVRQSLRPHLKPQPRRARELEAIIGRHGRLYLPEVWPQLSVLAVWLGGSVGVYVPLVQQYYGQVPLRDHGLSASEGHMAIPIEDGTSTGVLEYVSHYFEFVPAEEHGRPHPTVLEAHELEEGKDYFILITNSAGLYRYDIHDVVRCTGFYGRVPMVRFLNKGVHFSSITGEKLTEAQVVAAVGRAFGRLGLRVDYFTVAPVMEDRPRYLLLLETGACPGVEEHLAASVNAELARLNWEYANRLETRRLNPLKIRLLPQGTWAAFRAQRIAQRGNLEEYKHPCLVGDLAFVGQLSSIRPPQVRRPHMADRRQPA